MTAIVWSKDHCSFCDQAKYLLKANNIEFEERKIGNGWTVEDLRSAVPDARTVPQIFMDQTHIGGYAELKKKLQGN